MTASVGEFLRTLTEAVLIVLAVSFLALGLHTKPFRLDFRPGLVVGLTIPLVLFHCGFRLGGLHTSILFWLYAVVMVSGDGQVARIRRAEALEDFRGIEEVPQWLR